MKKKIIRFTGLWIRITITIICVIQFNYIKDGGPKDPCGFIFIEHLLAQLMAFIMDDYRNGRKISTLYKIFSFITGLILSITAIYFGHFICASFILIVSLISILIMIIIDIENGYK